MLPREENLNRMICLMPATEVKRMKKKEILTRHDALEARVTVLEKNGDGSIQESWATVVEKLKELEARNADQRHGVQSLLRRIETLEIQFREKRKRKP